MDDMYVLSPRLRTWSRDDWHIYFDSQNFAWAKVNSSGKMVLDLCATFLPVSTLQAEIAARTSLTVEDISGALEGFLSDMVTAGILHRNRYHHSERGEFGHMRFPSDVYLHVTDKCNLKCSYCYNKEDRLQKMKQERKGDIEATLTTEEMRALLESLVRNDVRKVLFTGGEALLRADLIELLEHTRKLSDERVQHGGPPVKIELLTNAILISEKIALQLCELVDTVTISLDGHEAHYHDTTRGKGTFDATIKGLRTLLEVRNAMCRATPHVCMVPVISEENVAAMPEIFTFALGDVGVDSLAPILFQAGDHQEVSLTKVPSTSVFFAALEETDRVVTRSGLARNRKKRPTVVPRHHCGVGSAEISIDAHGTVYPCQSLHYDSFKAGNIRNDRIEDILTSSPVMQMVRGADVDSLKVCSHCDLRHLCNGGCRATAFNLYKEFDHHNEFYCTTLETFAVNRLWAATESLPEEQVRKETMA